MGNASHLLKCRNTNKLKTVKGEKESGRDCPIIGRRIAFLPRNKL